MFFKTSQKRMLATGIAAASLFAGSAHASWSTEFGPGNTNLQSHIYTPSGNNPRSLMVVLHGCGQTANELRNHGNLASAAEARNAIILVPNADDAWTGHADAGCWAYDGGTDYQNHAADIISATQDLLSRSHLNIDPQPPQH